MPQNAATKRESTLQQQNIDPYKILHDLAVYFGLRTSGNRIRDFNLSFAVTVVLKVYQLHPERREPHKLAAQEIALLFVSGAVRNRPILKTWEEHCASEQSEKIAAE